MRTRKKIRKDHYPNANDRKKKSVRKKPPKSSKNKKNKENKKKRRGGNDAKLSIVNPSF